MSKNFGTNEATAEAFVSRQYSSGHNGNDTMSWNDSVFCSYRTIVARFVEVDGQAVLWLTNHNYSRTTNRHLSLLRRNWKGRIESVTPAQLRA